MSKAFNHFVSNNGQGILFKSYNHASKLYVDNNYARAPKLGFMYFVSFNINAGVVKDQAWLTNGQRDVGLLVKKIDLPKFKISSEAVNQYNRKVNVQTKITYEPVSIEFHDDNSEISNGLWKNYYKYYYQDSNYGDTMTREAYQNNKFGLTDYAYGLSNYQNTNFFDSISIFVLHQQKFTEMTLANPLITSWEHDKLDQSLGNNILANKMYVAYEDVIYRQGNIVKDQSPTGFGVRYYDTLASPLSVGGNKLNSVPSAQGILPNESQVFNNLGTYPQYSSPLVGLVQQPGPGLGFSSPLVGLVQQPGPGLGLLDKARAQQGGSSLSIGFFQGHLQISGGVQLGPVRLGFDLFSGRGGLHGSKSITAGPIRLANKI